MESMFFFFLVVICWTPALIILLIGLILNRNNRNRKTFFILGMSGFLIPLLIAGVIRTNQYFEQLNFEGTYTGSDKLSNEFTLEINHDKTFQLSMEGCSEFNSKGKWQFEEEFNMYWLKAEENEFYIYKDQYGVLTLFSETKTNCSDLDEIKLIKN